MRLYHCISNIDPIMEGVLRCPALIKNNSNRTHLDQLIHVRSYRKWRENDTNGYQEEMLIKEMESFIVFYDQLTNAVKKTMIPAVQRIVLACDIHPEPPATQLLTPCYGDKSLASPTPSVFIHPTKLQLESALKQVYVQYHMQDDVVRALRAAKPQPLDAKIVLFEMEMHVTFPMYSPQPDGKIEYA